MRIFCCSDLHSFFDAFISELHAKGFEENNPNHLLVICGDVFDRGNQSADIFNYLDSLTNVVLIRGNHEDLMEDMLSRGYGQAHDISNGTTKSAVHLINNFNINKDISTGLTYQLLHEKLKPFFNKFINYFETKNYIFVHGWIPCDKTDMSKTPFHLRNRSLGYNKDWRTSSDSEWRSARWINGITAGYENKIIEPDKTIVCGHWHCSAGHAAKLFYEKLEPENIWFDREELEFGPDACFDPFAEKGILAIDACTAWTGHVNVVVLEDELLDT